MTYVTTSIVFRARILMGVENLSGKAMSLREAATCLNVDPARLDLGLWRHIGCWDSDNLRRA